MGQRADGRQPQRHRRQRHRQARTPACAARKAYGTSAARSQENRVPPPSDTDRLTYTICKCRQRSGSELPRHLTQSVCIKLYRLFVGQKIRGCRAGGQQIGPRTRPAVAAAEKQRKRCGGRERQRQIKRQCAAAQVEARALHAVQRAVAAAGHIVAKEVQQRRLRCGPQI